MNPTKEAKHLEALIDSGLSVTRISELTGLHRDTIRRVRGNQVMLSNNSELLMAVKPLRGKK